MKPNKSSHKQDKSLSVLRDVFLSACIYFRYVFFLLKPNHGFVFREGSTMQVCFSFCKGKVITGPISLFGIPMGYSLGGDSAAWSGGCSCMAALDIRPIFCKIYI
jgi:hypothetical protein